MKTMTLLRYATLAALLASALPTPASAQFGGLRKKLKEKIINAAVDGAVNKVMGPDSSASATTPGASRSGSGAPAGATRARKGAPPAGPVFDAETLEITPDVLDRLEKALAAEIGGRKAAEAAEKKAQADYSRQYKAQGDYNDCKEAFEHSPEARKLQEEYIENLSSAKAMQAQGILMKHAQQLMRAKCGEDPGGYPSMPSRGEKGDAYKQGQDAGAKAFGLGERQYAIVKERVAPFCWSAKDAAQLSYVYAPGEISAMTPRCDKLLPLLNGI